MNLFQIDHDETKKNESDEGSLEEDLVQTFF